MVKNKKKREIIQLGPYATVKNTVRFDTKCEEKKKRDCLCLERQ